jgi:uncharacterized membrane protein
VSVTALLALSLATVFGFVAYLHGVVRLMRVQYLLEAIATETRRAIQENFPPASAYVDVEPPTPDPAPLRLCYTGTPASLRPRTCTAWPNDPTTGVQAIDRISDLLAITGNRLDPTGLRVDSGGTVRVKRKLRNFDSLLVLSLTEIIRYGADAPQVVRRLRAVLDELECTLPAERQDGIACQRGLLEAAATSALPAPFTGVSSTADREGLG